MRQSYCSKSQRLIKAKKPFKLLKFHTQRRPQKVLQELQNFLHVITVEKNVAIIANFFFHITMV